MPELFLKRICLFLFWVAIIAGSLYFFMDNVVAYFYGYRSRMWGNSFFNNQLWVSMHMVGGTLTLLLGPLQFWHAVRKRFMKFHRISGKIYMPGIGLIGI